jgi:cellulose synthase/poly-beta-1,6-N-acetylglucosamine synthase-like glycosyltransferase
VALALLHFGAPLAYYCYLRAKWLRKPWGVRRDPGYKPKVSIIVPTYNEAALIESKLDDIAGQDYPRELMEVIVVDSASTDGTPEKVEEWARRNPGLKLVLIREPARRGKAFALNNALRYAAGEVVVITDVDSLWPDRETLKKAVMWFADPLVGAVSCLKRPVGSGVRGVEEGYRRYYNVLRVAESKAFSTPIFHGELAAFRKNLLEKVGGFPTNIGADDSHTATRIALMGYRAIVPEDLWIEELVPNKDYFWWRVRRAQHLIQHFTKILQEMLKAPKELRKILAAEVFFHIINPYLLLASTILLVISMALARSLTALALLVLGVALLAVKPYRTWTIQQIFLVTACVRNLWTKELVWKKQIKTDRIS